MNAADVMTRDIVTVAPDTSLVEAIRLMLKVRVSGLPVVDDLGRLVGLLTEGDLLHRVETGTDVLQMGWLRALATRGYLADQYVHSHGRRVQDVMTRDVITVSEDSPLTDIIRVMESKHFRRVPVIDGDRLVGIVSRSDLVRVLGSMLTRQDMPEKSDREIQTCILAEIRRLRWAPVWNVNVSVTTGSLHYMATFSTIACGTRCA
jgi:CBS domain-containing protein